MIHIVKPNWLTTCTAKCTASSDRTEGRLRRAAPDRSRSPTLAEQAEVVVTRQLGERGKAETGELELRWRDVDAGQLLGRPPKQRHHPSARAGYGDYVPGAEGSSQYRSNVSLL